MKKIVLFTFLFICSFSLINAQEKKDTAPVDTFRFTVVKELPITPVKNQSSSGTCWSFSGLGLFEAELLRLGKPEVDLSEMFVVYHSYSDQAEKYVRMHGALNFSAGGSFHDVLYVLKNYGIVPESLMPGLNYGENMHKHGELDAVTSAYVKAVIQNKNKKLSTAWKKGFDGVLDAYLGELPTEFALNGKKYTPQSYAQSLGLNFDDYVSLTSYTHHPFYGKFALEIPDNWRWGESYNLPLDEFMQVFDNAINNGYALAWGSDVSERGFSRNGIAVNPETRIDNLPGSDQARWLNISEKQMLDSIYKLNTPQPEIKVTQELRQQGFDNYETTDDHGMLIYGIAKDQNGTKYYMVKNSWGTDSKYKGIWYASESFVQQKTMNIMVHKDAIPKDVKKKLGIK
ncbi:aminopeptidase [Paludibacter sp. 221]|uniref:aminopeptidase C n=1 Tax=Paludibacter sp. 221 TaxID=2302939 RepID=UPI0013D21FF7|nr:C1 family peptidase [Paludibacter sp. 221]NDV46222.1 aminopeptidase [Paludibacter sp. 221]